MAEPLVESERIGLDLGDAIDRAGSRQQQQIDAIPHRFGFLAQFGEALADADHRSARDRLTAGDDLPGHRMQALPLAAGGLVDGRHALDEPGAAVQQRARREERVEIDVYCRAAEPGEARNRGLEQRGGIRVAEELPLLWARHAESKACRHRAETRKPGGAGREYPSSGSAPRITSSTAAAS